MARYTLAVDRRYRKDGKAETDFISCVTFGKNAEFVEEHYFAEGKKLSGSEKKEDTDPDGFMSLPDGEELPFE